MAANDSIKVLDKFEGAMIGDYSIKNDTIFMHLKKEKPTYGFRDKKFDYNLHFHFGIQNQTVEKKAVGFFIECKNEEDLFQLLPRIWISSDINKEYSLENNIIGKTDFHGKYVFKLNLEAKQILYLANFPPIRFTKLNKIFQELSSRSNAHEVIIGRTVNNQCIKAFEFGDIKDKPTILFVAGFHPPERDTVAIEAIMEKFLDIQWREKILERYSFSFIPILNPDGFANAMQGSNSNEINFHWKFFGNSKKLCPESYSIWEYCSRITPVVFFDFHSFTFQNNEARPYCIPKGYQVGRKTRSIQNHLNVKLKDLCSDKYSKNAVIFAPNLLATRLRNEFGTITVPKFHLHMKDGIEGSKQMALDCLEIVLKGLYRYDVNLDSEILKFPYGENKITVFDKFRINFLNFWHFTVLGFLKKILFYRGI